MQGSLFGPVVRKPRLKDSDSIRRKLSQVNWDFADYNPGNGGSHLHGIHWYPASFPPAVPTMLIDILGANAHTFLDPYCGGGIGPVEAWLRGKTAFGIDNNPLAVDIARSKIDLLESGDPEVCEVLVADYLAYRTRALNNRVPSEVKAICLESRMDFDCVRWFIPSVLAEIALIKNWVNYQRPITRVWDTVLRTTLSSLLHRELSTVRTYHYTYIVDRSRVRNPAVAGVNVAGLFVKRLRANFIEAELLRNELKRREAWPLPPPPPRFLRGCAQDLEKYTKDKFDLIITSPPYFGMNDYVRSQYLSWLVFQWPGYEQDISTESGSRRCRTSETSLKTYLSDMQHAFGAVFNRATKGGYLAVIIGSSTTKIAEANDPMGKLNSLLLAQGFVAVWSGRRRVQFRKINNVPFREEHIWVFQRR